MPITQAKIRQDVHIIVCGAMMTLRYQAKSCFNISSAHKRSGNYRTRPRNRIGAAGGPTPVHARRLLTVSFLKNGMSRITRDITEEGDADTASTRSSGVDGVVASTSDRAYLIDDVSVGAVEPRRESGSEFSLGSGVSGYESDTEPCRSETTGVDDTDVDAAVREYHEHVRVATLSGSIPMTPTEGTASRVALATVALIPSCIALAASMNRAPQGYITGIMLAASSGLLTFLLLIVISRQPQRPRPPKYSSAMPNSQDLVVEGTAGTSSAQLLHHSMVPWVPAGGIFLHCCLLLEALDLAGSPFAVWLSVGLTVYFSYGVFKSIAAPVIVIKNERLHLSSPHQRPSVASTVVCGAPSSADTSTSNASEPYAQIDTVLIT